MKLCVLQVGALKLSPRDEVGKVGWGLPTFCCNLLRGKAEGKRVSFLHGVEKKTPQPFAHCRFAPSDANQRRRNRVFWVHLGVTRFNVTRFAPTPTEKKSLSGKRNLTEIHLEDLQRVCIGRKWFDAQRNKHCCCLNATLPLIG